MKSERRAQVHIPQLSVQRLFLALPKTLGPAITSPDIVIPGSKDLPHSQLNLVFFRFIDFREREILICCPTYSCSHPWLGMEPTSPGTSGWCSGQLSSLARALSWIWTWSLSIPSEEDPPFQAHIEHLKHISQTADSGLPNEVGCGICV